MHLKLDLYISNLKVLLVYEEKFWKEQIGSFSFINLIKDKEELLNRINPDQNNYILSWIDSVCEFEQSLTRENSLVVWLSGSFLHESLSDEEIKQGLTEMLRKYLNDPTIPEPKEILRSKWNSDPLFCGAYSYYCTKSKEDFSRILAEPIFIDKVRFSLIKIFFFNFLFDSR
jgi:spermine oxidase